MCVQCFCWVPPHGPTVTVGHYAVPPQYTVHVVIISPCSLGVVCTPPSPAGREGEGQLRMLKVGAALVPLWVHCKKSALISLFCTSSTHGCTCTAQQLSRELPPVFIHLCPLLLAVWSSGHCQIAQGEHTYMPSPLCSWSVFPVIGTHCWNCSTWTLHFVTLFILPSGKSVLPAMVCFMPVLQAKVT